MKEQVVTGNASEDYKRYEKLLIQNIEYLCDNEPPKVIPELKKKYYPIQICMEICTRKKNAEAVAYLLRRSGDFAKSLDAYLDIMKKVSDDMTISLSKEFVTENVKRFEDLFHSAQKVCEKNSKNELSGKSSEDPWFLLLEHLYLIMMNYSKSSKFEAQTLKIPLDTVNKCIQDLLNAMMKYVPFPSILTRVAEKHGELEIEKFKEMFLKMLSSYVYQEKILQTASKISATHLASQFKYLSRIRCKGVPVSETKCAKCDRQISNKISQDVTAFSCGHLYHTTCMENDEKICFICTYKDASIFIIKT